MFCLCRWSFLFLLALVAGLWTAATTVAAGEAETGTLRGKAVYDAEPPVPRKLKISDHADAHCLKGDTTDLTWVVDPKTKAVANVVVWLRPADGLPFSVPERLRKRTDKVVLDTPFCNYRPHVVALFPSCWDPTTRRQLPTGQQFFLANTSPLNHCPKFASDNPLLPENTGNFILRPAETRPIGLKPCPDTRCGEDRVLFGCTVRRWMLAHVWVFDHPWFAVSKEDGTFEIKGIPPDLKLHVVAWHEAAGTNGFLLPAHQPGRKGEPLTVQAGKVSTLDLKVKQ